MNSPLSTSTSKKEYTIAVVTGKGGGGHYATYNAIRAIAEQENLPWRFQVTDMDDIMASMTEEKKVVNAYSFLGGSVHELYNRMLKSNWTWLWFFLIRLNKLLVKLNYDAGVRFFEQYWREHQPDLVLSIVTMCNGVLWDALQKAKPGTPYVTLPIDFADYPPGFWFEPKTDSYAICATEKALEQARSLGVKEECIVPTSGMVIHPRFYQPLAGRAAEREKLGVAPDCLTGLVMFGGNGSDAMLDIADRLVYLQDRLQLIFLCGRNEELATALRDRPTLQKRAIVTFTQDVPYYMHLSDFFIGKPGPGSLSEALAMKLPVITECNASTLLHERYNAEWVREKQVGIVLRSFRQIDRAVGQLLVPQILDRYRSQVAKLGNRAVFEVVARLQQILAERSNVSEFVTDLVSQERR